MPNWISVKKERKHAVINFPFFRIKFKIKLKPHKLSHPVIVIFGPIGIGDYMIYRRYFKYIKTAPKFKDASIIYISRDIYKDFVATYDSEYFDIILDYNIEKLKSAFYRNFLAQTVNTYKPDIFFSLSPNTNVDNKFVPFYKKIKAKEKCIGIIQYTNNPDADLLENKIFNNKYYFNHFENIIFESERCRKEFEQFLGISIPIEDTKLDVPLKTNKKHIAISCCASSRNRMISTNKWVEIINYIISNTDKNMEILLLGSKTEKRMLNTLISKIDEPERCTNLAGLSISLIPLILKFCEFLISVESGNVHIAHETGCKTICLSGSHEFGRFHPYKDNIIKYIYPERFIKYINNKKDILKLPPPELDFNVSEINFDIVKEEINKLINKTIT